MISVMVYPQRMRAETALIGNITDKVSSLSFSVDAVIGYDSLSLSFAASLSEIAGWLSDGVLREVRVMNSAHRVVWEGFVNTVNAPLGNVSVSSGPLMDVSNKVSVSYTTKRYNTNPPIGGEPGVTDFASDTDSQALYGILEEKVSAGEGNATQMDQLRDVYLTERAYPETSMDLSLFSGSEPSVSLDCLGYAHLLERYYYLQRTNSSTVNIDTKIAAVLDADPNSLFSSSNFDADTNATQIGRYEDGERTALTVIKEAVSLGDSSDNRYIFGVYDNLSTKYYQAPTVAEYFYNEISDTIPQITKAGGEKVDPWDVLPGKWIFLAGIGSAYVLKPATRSDPRNLFIERIEYTAPLGLSITGGRVSRFSQKLARLGLGIY